MKFIEPFLFFYTLGVNIFYGIFQQILFKVICQRKFNATWNVCSSNETFNSRAQLETSKFNLYLNIGCLIPALFVPVMCSTLGPSVGSNRLLFLPLIGDTLSFGFVGLYEVHDRFKNELLVILLSVVNVIGGYSVARALCNNYVSASSSDSGREKRFLLMEIICVVSYTLSGILGGYILYYLSIRIGIYICFSLMLLAFIFLSFVQNVECDKTSDTTQTTPLNNSSRQLKNVLHGIPPKNRVYIVLFLISEFLTSFAEAGALDILVLYCLRTEFNFSSLAIGWILSTVHAVKALGSLLIYPLVITKCRVPGWILSLINQFTIVGYFLMFGFATKKAHIVAGSLFFLFDGSVSALISTTLSDSCEGNSRGMIFGIHSTITEIGSVVGCILADFIYLETLAFFPGLTHLILGAIMFLGCLLASIGLFIDHRNKKAVYFRPPGEKEEKILLSKSSPTDD